MKRWIEEHKRFLAMGAAGILVAACVALAAPQMLRQQPAGLTLPIATVTPRPMDPFDAYREKRAEERRSDRASLEKLLERKDIDQDALEDAAKALARLIQWNEEELAIEGALAQSRLSPCLAIRGEGMVTLVTKKTELSDAENALLLAMCQTHAGIAPAGVQVICAE